MTSITTASSSKRGAHTASGKGEGVTASTSGTSLPETLRATIEAMPLEEALRSLEEALLQLESGELTLDESIAVYERGVALAGRCDALLAAAQLRVRLVDGEGRDAGGMGL